MAVSAPLRRLNGGDAILKNADYLSDANGTSEPDYAKCGPAAIVKVGAGDYRCWYEGVTPVKTLDATNQTGTFDYDTSVCYATSSDGIAWTKRDNDANSITDRVMSVAITPTNPGSGSLAWMRGETSPGTVLYDSDAGIWKMWGHGGNNTGPRAIFYATSSDGLSWTFQNTGQPVLQKGSSGAWDGNWVADARVIRLSSTSYFMLYRGTPVSGMPQVGLATSTDGISWTKYGSNPVIASGAGGQWDDQAIYIPGIHYDPDTGLLHAWYGGDATGDTAGQGLGYAVSSDFGQTFTKAAFNPVLSLTAGGLDSVSIGDTIGAYQDGTAIRVHYASEKSGTPYFRGRLLAEVDMATNVISMLRHATKPDNSGNCYQEPAAINLQSNDRYPQMVWVYKNSGSARIGLGGRFAIPEDYVGTAKVRLVWATTATSGAARLEFDYKAVAASESSDPSADDESVGSTVTCSGTARLTTVTDISLTSANFAPGDIVQFQVVRDKSDAADTLAASVYLIDAQFVYNNA